MTINDTNGGSYPWQPLEIEETGDDWAGAMTLLSQPEGMQLALSSRMRKQLADYLKPNSYTAEELITVLKGYRRQFGYGKRNTALFMDGYSAGCNDLIDTLILRLENNTIRGVEIPK